MTAPWIEALRDHDVAPIARALGIDVSDGRGTTSRGSFPCPACGQNRRHRSRRDRRGAVGITGTGRGWRCHECGEGGDAISLVRIVERGNAATWTERHFVLGVGSLARPAPSPAPEPAPVYPPSDEVSRLWASCTPVTGDAQVVAYLRGRDLDPVAIADLDVARSLPLAPSVPWAQAWVQRRLRIVLPLVDAHGVMRSVLARTVVPAAELAEGALKSVAPKGFSRRGLLLACPFARQLLHLGAAPTWWPAGVPLRVVVAEGEMDHLDVMTRGVSDADTTAQAVLGLISGSWTNEVAARIPDGAAVTIATHADEAGEAYAAKVIASLQDRHVALSRWSPA